MSESFNLLKEIKYLERIVATELEVREKNLASGKRELEAVTKMVAERQATVNETKARLAQLRSYIVEINAMPKPAPTPKVPVAKDDKAAPKVAKAPKVPNPDKAPSCADRIIEALTKYPGASSADIVAGLSELKKDTVQWTLGNLVKKGLVLRDDGKHRVKV